MDGQVTGGGDGDGEPALLHVFLLLAGGSSAGGGASVRSRDGPQCAIVSSLAQRRPRQRTVPTMQQFDLDLLPIFEAVARTRSFSSAARELGRPKSSVS